MEIADAMHNQPKVSGFDDLGKRLNDQPFSFFRSAYSTINTVQFVLRRNY